MCQNYLATSTAANGYSTTYNYDAYKGTLKSVTDANGKETKYTYDANTDRMTSVEAVDTASTAVNSKVEYTYAKNGQLTSIKSPGSSPTYNFVYDKWGNNKYVKVGNQTLVTNTYKSNNGLLTQQEYGNEFTVGHNYDSLDRETSRSYNGATKFYWTYNADGNLARYSENGNRVLTYLYDDIGRLLQVSGNDGSYVKTSYDKLDKSTDLHYKFNGQRRDVYFNYYNMDNLPLNVKFGTDSKYIIENNYDELTRLKFKTYTIPNTNSKINTSYSYVDWSSTENRTTGTVRGINYTFAANGLSTHDRWYTYDNVGNILTECSWISSSSKPVQESYTYDAKNQLVKHDSVSLNAIYTYEYDLGGNIKSKTIYNKDSGATSTINYTYGNSAWGDELTAYNGESIVYDKIGNPTTYRGWGMTWQGRQLTKAVKDKTVTFTYDSEGIRTSKSDGTNTTKYLLNGTQILAQTTNGKTLCFFYDQQGNRVAMADGSNKFYYYIYNLQGDVIALADASTGKLVVTYTYDAWGKLVKLEDTTANSVGTQNPFRYRGYYYDTETSLYYLQSRYYDPDTGRFISADGQLNEGVLGYNMFAYCENNPVNRADSTGEAWYHWALGAAIVVGCAVATVATCGGFAAAAMAVGMVSSGVAASTTAATVAAAAFIGSSTAYGVAALTASSNSRSVKEFCDQGNWGTVAATAGGAIINGYSGYVASNAKASQNSAASSPSGNSSYSHLKYPGNDPAKCNQPGFEWRGSGSPASGKGNYVNMSTGEWLHPDLNHGPPIGPHWDYGVRGSTETVRIFSDGSVIPK